MQTDRRAAIEALQKDACECLPRAHSGRLAWRRSSTSPTVGELIGLLLMDLDLLGSQRGSGWGSPPEYATEFMNKRLARRLANRYRGRDLVAEFDRRFAAAIRPDSDGEEVAPVLARMRASLDELQASLT